MKESQQRGHAPARTWRALSFKSACQFTMASHLAQPSLTKSSLPRPPASPAHGKCHPTPPCTSASIQFATKQRHAAWARLLGPRGTGTGQARWQRRPRLGGVSPNECMEPTRTSSNCQNTAGWAARDVGRGGGVGWGGGSSVGGSGPCSAGCANETVSGSWSLAGQSQDRHDPIREHDSGHSISLPIVTPPFARGL